MPGLVFLGRRWSVGSDDLVVPGAFFFLIHAIWLVILSLVLSFKWDRTAKCALQLWYFDIGFLVLLIFIIVTEFAICFTSTRGSILDTSARASLNYFLYVRLVLMLLEAAFLTVGSLWIKSYYQSCPINEAKEIMLGLVVSNACVIASMLVTIWCVYDAAGGSWVKMKNYQRSMREAETKGRIQKRSGSRNRNWRQRKVMRAYQDSWDSRCRLLFCCIRKSDRNRNSFADIARLLSEFFRDLDVVPSDVVAGLLLLRKFQKIERELIIKERKNDTYYFLSGVPITPRTKFLSLTEAADLEQLQNAIHYMHFARAAYGWPLYLYNNSMGLCQLCYRSRCHCILNNTFIDETIVIEDNCCQCNYSALMQMLELDNVEVVYVSFHVDVAETPFFVALDHAKKQVVVSIRGTLSMKDVMTDLNAESEVIPVFPPREDWFGHKGMVHAAEYINKKLLEDEIISKALQHNSSVSKSFGLTVVGHSLGAGTAAILAILLKQNHPDISCFAFSPPGGLLSMPAQSYTETFITSVVLGKDVVPRIGLRQMESLRADLINAIKRSVDPKWQTITCSMMCCCGTMPTSAARLEAGGCSEYQRERDLARSAVVPEDANTALSLHRHLYPPGRIIHVVRHHLQQKANKPELVYQALWADPRDFDEVLISPVMIQDHMPDNLLEALNKVMTNFGPEKPKRLVTDHLVTQSNSSGSKLNQDNQSRIHQKSLCFETSFTSLPSPIIDRYTKIGRELSLDSGESPWEYLSLNSRIVCSSRNEVSCKSVACSGALASVFRSAPLATPETLSDASSSTSISPIPCIQMVNKSPKASLGTSKETRYQLHRGPPPPVPRRRDSVHLFVDQRICKGICCSEGIAERLFPLDSLEAKLLNDTARFKKRGFEGDTSLPLLADLLTNSHGESSV